MPVLDGRQRFRFRGFLCCTDMLMFDILHGSDFDNLQAAVPMADGGDVGAAGYEAALDGLEALRSVLRDEHSLLTQYKMIVWGRVFTPVQASSHARSEGVPTMP